jgi:hypothetical protein
MNDPFAKLSKNVMSSMKRKRNSPMNKTHNAETKRLAELHAKELQLLRNMHRLSNELSKIRVEVNKMIHR